VNGALTTQPVDGSLNPSSVLARVKVMASLNVSERRKPQDGRIGLMLHGRSIDIRVSTIPTSHGESIACRLLDPKSLKLGWSDLGFTDDVAQSIQGLIEQPHGLFLVTGPTGSGKTTTLYTALAHLNDEKQKILSVEDPVEYDLDGVDQVQVNEAVGMTFSKALRAFLRHDPNVIMIGEIRDEETAEIACRSALVGRLVLSTLHTNSPKEVVTRLQDLGVPKYILDSVLLGALGQKLEPGPDGRRVLQAQLVRF
jgi:general secretion pathway protein E